MERGNEGQEQSPREHGKRGRMNLGNGKPGRRGDLADLMKRPKRSIEQTAGSVAFGEIRGRGAPAAARLILGASLNIL
jgi:hypothetical protein